MCFQGLFVSFLSLGAGGGYCHWVKGSAFIVFIMQELTVPTLSMCCVSSWQIEGYSESLSEWQNTPVLIGQIWWRQEVMSVFLPAAAR